MFNSSEATRPSLLGFWFRAHGLRQRTALAAYHCLFMVDQILRYKLKLTKRRFPHPLLTDVVVAAPWGRFFCRRGTSDPWIAGPMFEPTTCSYLKQEIAEGVFVDVGSHIGRHSVQLALRLGTRGRVVAIEPHPDTFQALKRNIALNELVNVTPVNVACWSSTGVATLVGEDDMASVTAAEGSNTHGRPLRVTTLDELLTIQLGLPCVDILKIDVEGGEEHVLRGATETIRNNPSLKIVFEAVDEPHLDRIRAFLQPLGFRIERLSWKNFVAFRSPASLEATTVH